MALRTLPYATGARLASGPAERRQREELNQGEAAEARHRSHARYYLNPTRWHGRIDGGGASLFTPTACLLPCRPRAHAGPPCLLWQVVDSFKDAYARSVPSGSVLTDVEGQPIGTSEALVTLPMCAARVRAFPGLFGGARGLFGRTAPPPLALSPSSPARDPACRRATRDAAAGTRRLRCPSRSWLW